MDLIIGTRHITPDAITRAATGIEAALHGNALMALVNAAFHGSGKVEILGGDLDSHRMEVTGIEMQGRDTRETLAAMEARQRLM